MGKKIGVIANIDHKIPHLSSLFLLSKYIHTTCPIEKENIKIINLLLENQNIDIDQKLINFYNLEFIIILRNSLK